MKIFHGSNTVVEHPDIRISGFNKDFGYGFYCTRLERQARRWASARKGGHVVNVYDFFGYDGCKTLVFDTMTDEWLDFIASCRRGISHVYDIVEGHIADDQIWNYVEDLVDGYISRTAFWELVKFRYPTHQIAFCTQEALSCLKYSNSYEL